MNNKSREVFGSTFIIIIIDSIWFFDLIWIWIITSYVEVIEFNIESTIILERFLFSISILFSFLTSSTIKFDVSIIMFINSLKSF